MNTFIDNLPKDDNVLSLSEVNRSIERVLMNYETNFNGPKPWKKITKKNVLKIL